MSEDPAGINLSDIRSFTNPQGWNTYSYGLNNPVRYIDPSGASWEEFRNYMRFGVYASNEQVANYERMAVRIAQNPNQDQLVSPQAHDYLNQRTFEEKLAEFNSCLLCSNAPTIDSQKANTENLSNEELIANRQAIADNGQAGMMPIMGMTGGVGKAGNAVKVTERMLQNSKAIAGAGAEAKAILKQAGRLTQQYGGVTKDWTKMTTREVFKDTDGAKYQIHYYYNKAIDAIVEAKKKY